MTLSDAMDAKLAEHRRHVVEGLGPQGVAWLALAPVWTEGLARLVEFPAKDEDLPTLLTECERLQWCVRREADHGLGPREAAELLTAVAVRLRTAAPGDPATDRAVQAAHAAIREIPTRRQAALLRRLDDLVEPAGAAARPDGPDEPRAHAVAAVEKTLDTEDTAAAARQLADLAVDLPAATVRRHVRTLLTRLADPDESPVAAPYLAAAAVGTGDVDLGMQVAEQPADRRTRVACLAEVARGLAAAGEHSRAGEVVGRIAEMLGEGAQVDLGCAADAAERVVHLGAGGAPILRRATAFPVGELAAQHVGPLVRLTAAARTAGVLAAASDLAARAVDLAGRQEDPDVRASGLVQVLPIVEPGDEPGLATGAWAATREMVDRTHRARLLAVLVPVLVRHGSGAAAQDELVELCQPPPGGDTFWMPDLARAQVLETLGDMWGSDELRRVTQLVGSAIRAAPVRRSIPEAALRWATLAERVCAEGAVGEQAGTELLARVGKKLLSGKTGEAGGWILAGRRLLPVVRDAFEASLLLAVRRVELVNRREHDLRLLDTFLPRAEQLAAFDELIGGADAQWALHLMGHGGVGKTMLVRHLCARVAPEKGWAHARVDFDHLNPEFPWRRPGQLLLELIEELEAFAPTKDSRRHFHDAVDHLRQLQWWADPAAKRPDLIRAVEKFCTYLTSLGKPVLLVLDTCEELAKFQPVDAVLPQLEAAFTVLEAVHVRVPTVRVVLSGRRPLARSGAGGWRIDESRDQRSLPERKEYLRVHVVKGFCRAEASTYLSTVQKLRLAPDTVRTVLERSTGTFRTPYLRGGPPDEPRYNPFDVALYAGLLGADPNASLDEATTNTYLVNRLIERLGRAAPLLPAAVAMRTFDDDMLAAAAMPTGIRLDDAWPQFAGAEWVQARLDPALPATFLSFDPGLLPRLQDYYRNGQAPSAHRSAGRELGGRLAALVRDRRTQNLAVAHVEGALRCLDPRDAAALCDELSRQVAEEGAWMWAFTVCGRLLDEEGVLAAPDHPARPAATALYATAAAHLDPNVSQAATWRTLLAGAAKHPEHAVRDWLRARAAVLGRPEAPGPLVDAVRLAAMLLRSTDRDDRARGSWLLGTVLAGAERLLDQLDGGGQGAPDLDPLRVALRDYTAMGHLPDDHAHVVSALQARLGRLSGDVVEARAQMAVALDRLDGGTLEWSAYLAADRPDPVHWRSRTRLRAVVAGLAEPQSHWLPDALADDVSQIDQGRLASALLTRWLDREPVPRDVLDTVEQAVGDIRPLIALVPVHRAVPPLRVALARGWLAYGEANRARAALGPPGGFADSAREQAELDVARMDIARRMRLTDSDRRLRRALSRAPDGQVRAVEAAALLDPAVPVEPAPGDPVSLHLWWRTQVGSPAPGPATDAVRAASPLREGGPAAIALAIDAAELALLDGGAVHGYGRIDGVVGVAHAKNGVDLRHAVRWHALNAEPGLPDGTNHAYLDRAILPPHGRLEQRLVAEIALEEGELLALRLPQVALPLLATASLWFDAAGDPVGTLIATTAAQLAGTRFGEEPRPVELWRLERAYRAVRRGRADLPSWAQLVDGSGDQAGDPPDWAGWLIRLRWLLAGPDKGLRRQFARTPGSPLPPELRSPAADRGVSSKGQLAETTAAVLARTREITAPTVPRARAGADTATGVGASHGPLRALARAARAALPWFGIVVVLVVISLGLWGLYGLFVGITDGGFQFVGIADGVGGTALRVAAFVGALIGLIVVGVKLITSGPGRSRVTIDIRAEVAAPMITATGTHVRRWPLPPSRRAGIARVDLPGDRRRPQVQPAVVEVVVGTVHPGHPLAVAWRVPPHLAALGWERALAEQLPGNVQVRQRRDYEPLPIPSLTGRSLTDRGVVRIAAPANWATLVRSAYPAGSTALTSLAELVEGDVAVLMASAVDTTTGRVLVVRVAAEQPVLLQPDDLDARDVVLVVCGEPGMGGRDTEADRLAAHDLRGCAGDLMEAGAGAVVVLPSMPEEFLLPALRLFGARASRGRAPLLVHSVGSRLRQGGLADIAAEITVMTRGM